MLAAVNLPSQYLPWEEGDAEAERWKSICPQMYKKPVANLDVELSSTEALCDALCFETTAKQFAVLPAQNLTWGVLMGFYGLKLCAGKKAAAVEECHTSWFLWNMRACPSLWDLHLCVELRAGPSEGWAPNEVVTALSCSQGLGSNLLPGAGQELGVLLSVAEWRTLGSCLSTPRCLLCLKTFLRNCGTWVTPLQCSGKCLAVIQQRLLAPRGSTFVTAPR